jgi:TolA-binding protein
MIHCRFAPSTFARATAILAFALVVNARAAETAAATSSVLTSLSAARDTAAPAVNETPAATLSPGAGTTTPAANGNAETATATAARNKKPSALNPHDEVRSLLNLGASLTEREAPDFEAAEIAYRQVLNSNAAESNDLKTALLGLAHMHRKKGELTKAAAIFERFLADFPGDDRSPDALLELGRTLRDMGAYKLAIARFYSVINSTLKISGENFDRYQVLAKTAQFEIADTYLASGDFEDANKYFTKFRLLDVAPADRARAQFKAACALRDGGKLDNAITALRAFIEQCPDDENIPEARYLLATTLRDLKRPQEAMTVALELLREEKSRVATAPKRWLHWQLVTGNQLANEFYNSGSIEEAFRIYRTLLDLSPDMSWRLPITYQLGLCYERLGIVDKARSSYASVIELAGPTPSQQFDELAQMAKWRIEHLDWREKTTREVNAFFDSTSGKQANISTDGAPSSATP